jgi:hypothetical protein
MTELTEQINTRIDTLKAQVNSLPGGGGLEVLRDTLMGLQDKIKAMVGDIDRLNGVKTPEKAPIKTTKSYYTNGFGCDRGEGSK